MAPFYEVDNSSRETRHIDMAKMIVGLDLLKHLSNSIIIIYFLCGSRRLMTATSIEYMYQADPPKRITSYWLNHEA